MEEVFIDTYDVDGVLEQRKSKKPSFMASAFAEFHRNDFIASMLLGLAFYVFIF